MKTSIKKIALTAIAGVLLSLLLYGCAMNQTYPIAESVLIDKTDTFLAKPDAEMIKGQYKANGAWEGYLLRVSTISDIDYNYTWEIKISPECQLLSNIYDRKDELAIFNSGIDSAFKEVEVSPTGKNSSSIYEPIIRELTLLKGQSSKRKILIVYSDLMEYSALSNFYDAQTIDGLKTRPDEFEMLFEKTMPVPDLTDIEAYFIFQPGDSLQSRQFETVSRFYKNLLIKHGASVTIAANLIL